MCSSMSRMCLCVGVQWQKCRVVLRCVHSSQVFSIFDTILRTLTHWSCSQMCGFSSTNTDKLKNVFACNERRHSDVKRRHEHYTLPVGIVGHASGEVMRAGSKAHQSSCVRSLTTAHIQQINTVPSAMAVRRPRIRSVYVVSQCDTGPHEICRGLWEVFKGFVGQLMMLAEGWDTVIPVPEAHRPNRTFNPTPTAADSCCGHTAVSGVQ